MQLLEDKNYGKNVAPAIVESTSVAKRKVCISLEGICSENGQEGEGKL